MACGGESFELRVPDAESAEASSSDGSSRDSPALDSLDACPVEGGACTPGSCCSGMHCVYGQCSRCKPSGWPASQKAECCDPPEWLNGACGVPTCRQASYETCGGMFGPCCPGSTCKLVGGSTYGCSCGAVDAPCRAGDAVQCCNGACSAGGWCP